MSLQDLTIQDEYRSDRDDLIQDFYIPCLERATVYDRAVGFFSSTSMSAVAAGLTAFIRSGGQMRLVTSPKLSAEDVQAIEQGLEQREQVFTTALLRELETELPQLVQDRLAALTWLLSQGLLEIKLAVPKTLRQQGIYHEKLGIFADEAGNVIAFTGSANESASALIDNFECIEVYPSWDKGVQQRAFRKVQHFQDLWHNRTQNVEVLAFPEAVSRSLLKLCPNRPPHKEPVEQKSRTTTQSNPKTATNPDQSTINHQPLSLDLLPPEPHFPLLPPNLNLRWYQEDAIANWFQNKGRGTLKMATGSGKTITALAIAAALYRKSADQQQPLQALIIICPYRHLVTQWAANCRQFQLEPILAFDRAYTWQTELQAQLIALKRQQRDFIAVITTNSTLRGDSFQAVLDFFPKRTLIIGDEAHNLGAQHLEQSLPAHVPFRLALSATPERYFDEEGTERLFDYFGSVIQPEFTLKDAIAAGALVPYSYHPLLVELTDREAEQYKKLTMRIMQLLAMDDAEESAKLTALVTQRSHLLGSAVNKLDVLRELMRQRLETTHTLFYCDDGAVRDEATDDSVRQLDAVMQILNQELGFQAKSYTAETTLDEREDLRYTFAAGLLPGVVAIRCLDEGVDIPATRTAIILASSSNPRQFVQRRGRILRPAAGKDRAELFDMIVVPPDFDRKTLATERNLLRKELIRVAEFADLATNAGEVRQRLYGLQERYGLLDL
ncbi:MAG: DEAD/DEAH box helicase family protein [Thainema sp.]